MFEVPKYTAPQKFGPERLFNYTYYRNYVSKTLQVYGQPCLLINRPNPTFLGYEDGLEESLEHGYSSPIPQAFTTYEAKCWIEFNIRKSVFYHFNWFPENSEDLVACYIDLPETAKEFNYIRTSIAGQVSIWGENMFSIERVMDDGMFKTLTRTYFLRPVVSQELKSLLDGRVSELIPKVVNP